MEEEIRKVIEDYDSLVKFSDVIIEHCILPEHYDQLAKAITEKLNQLKQ